MSKVFIEESTLTAIGNAIRAKEGSTALIAPGNMATKIANLPTGGGEPVTTDDMVIDLVSARDYGATITSLPSGITKIRAHAFSSLYKLAITSIPDTVTSVEQSAFAGTGITLSGLPSNLKTIEAHAFQGVKFTSPLIMPASLQSIAMYAFQQAGEAGTEIIFLAKPKGGLSSSAFYNSKFTSIKVPWSEGEVAGAPWGATNATITYDYIHEEA